MNQTADITTSTTRPAFSNETDRKIAALLVKSFRQNYNSAERKLTNDVIVRKVRERGYKFGGAKLRRLMGVIRHHNFAEPGFIVSDNEGYWYTEDLDEKKAFWASQRGRVIEIMKNVHPLYQLFKMNPQQLLLEFLEHLELPVDAPQTKEEALQ